jgi:hypothetical protein
MANVKITVKNGTTVLVGAKVRYTVLSVEESKLTDANGIVVVEGLAAGPYTFKGSFDGYTDGSVDVAVTDTAVAEGVIALKVYSATAIAAGETVDEMIADLTDALNTRIANSKGFAKYGYIVLLLLLGTKSETMVKYVKNKLS